MLFLHASRALIAADIHFAYEDVIGGALPTWSTAELVTSLLVSAKLLEAREIILLGDIIHGSSMSDGAARAVRLGLEALRTAAALTLVAGNHEGKSRGAAVLGETVESALRDGWFLVHGDRMLSAPELASFNGVVIGHLHPSLALGGGASAPAFLSSDRLIVVPALTPYSGGLNVFSAACLQALAPFNVASRQLEVVAAAGDLLYPFGTLSSLRKALAAGAPTPRNRYQRKFLRPD
ncbi:MAG: hypothetical protein ABR508_03220 [Candidatus Baltobacteraceae bacterium]